MQRTAGDFNKSASEGLLADKQKTNFKNSEYDRSQKWLVLKKEEKMK